MQGFTLTNIHGRPVSRDSIAGRPTVVEFWATWCPPCRGTLRWLGELQRRYGDRVALLAIAVESDEAMVRKVTQELGLPIRTAMARPEVVRAFGDLGAVPTLFLFDRDGRTASVHYGATPTLHAEVTETLERLLSGAGGK